MTRQAKLYVTDDCSLCDKALQLLLDTEAMHGFILTTVDIALETALFEQYGERIPVLEAGTKQLDWPFSSEQVSDFLEKLH